jgi:transposase
MNYQRGIDRSQVQMLPACVEDYVPANAPVRFIDAFVGELDFQTLGFKHAQPAATGRPPYHPGDLLRLYLYGYLNRIRSSRRLEAEAGRNLELIWLLGGLRPDFKTIADFRKDNRATFKGLFKQFNLLCRQLDLFGAELVAIDGCKFKAVNNVGRNYSRKRLEELTQKVEERIEDYLGQLDQQDSEAEGVPKAPDRQALEEKISKLRGRKGKYDQLIKQLDETKQNEVSLTDADSRSMQRVGVGYNVQVAVDNKHHLVAVAEVVQKANDRNQLAGIALAAKEALQVEKLKVVADAGYHEACQLEACEAAQIETYVPDTGKTSGRSKDGEKIFPKEDFVYNAQSDSYQCPGGQTMGRHHTGKCRGKDRITYYNRKACRRCPLKAQCTQSRYRTIVRLINEEVVERAARRLAANREIMAKRKTIVEHVFGTLREWNHDRLLMKGLERVKAEFDLSALTYNLRRVLNLLSVQELMAVVRKQTRTEMMPG